MKTHLLFLSILLTLVSYLFAANLTLASSTLDLQTYLSQVQSESPSFKASKLANESADLQLRETALFYSPKLNLQYQLLNDKKTSAFFPYQKLLNNTLTAAISQQTPWGLSGQIKYELDTWDYVGMRPKYYEGHSSLELSLSLWKNFLGRETQAQEALAKAQIQSQVYLQKFQSQAALTEAEVAFYRAQAAQQLLKLADESLKRAEELYQWAARRARSHLGDESDSLQASANLELKKIQKQTAQEQLNTAFRNLNQYRPATSDTNTAGVVEKNSVSFFHEPLTPVAANLDFTPPLHPSPQRQDLLAKKQAQEIARAQALLGKERNTPDLQLYGAFGLNSRESTQSHAVSESFQTDQPTRVIGIKLTTPLNLMALSDARSGYQQATDVADLNLQDLHQKAEVEWRELTAHYQDAKSRFKAMKTIEQIQKQKSQNEQKRLSLGKTTTYQTLLFEQDYNQASAGRIQTEAEILELIARLKLLGSQ